MNKLQKRFSIVDALKFGFSTTIENIGYFLGMFFTWFAIIVALMSLFSFVGYLFFPQIKTLAQFVMEHGQALTTALKDKTLLPAMIPSDIAKYARIFGFFINLFAVLFMWITTYLFLGLTKASFEFYDVHAANFHALFSQARIAWKSLITTVLYTLIVAVGLCLLIVPGIVWAVQFSFYNQFLVDQDMGIMQSLRASSQLTKGAKLHLLGFYFILYIINVLATLFLGIGLLITIPVTALAMVYAYRKLRALPVPR